MIIRALKLLASNDYQMHDARPPLLLLRKCPPRLLPFRACDRCQPIFALPVLQTTKEHYELEFDVRAEGFQSSAGEGAVDPANPVLELTLAEDGKEDEASSLFSIAKYGKQFEEETWKHVE